MFKTQVIIKRQRR